MNKNDCTRTAYSQAEASRKIKAQKKEKPHGKNTVVLEPSRIEYCECCDAWHISRQKLGKRKNANIEIDLP